MQQMGIFPQLGVVGWTTPSQQQQQTGSVSSTRQQGQQQPVSAALQQQLMQLQQAAQQQQMLANAAQSVATASASTPITLSVSSVNNSGLVVGQAGLNNTQTQQDEAAQSTREDRPGADDNTFE